MPDTMAAPTELMKQAGAQLTALRAALAARKDPDDLVLSPNGRIAYEAETRRLGVITIPALECDLARLERAHRELVAASSPHVSLSIEAAQVPLTAMRGHFLRELATLPEFSQHPPEQARIQQLRDAVEAIDGTRPIRRAADGRLDLPRPIGEALATLKEEWPGSLRELEERRAGAAERLRQARLEYEAAFNTLGATLNAHRA